MESHHILVPRGAPKARLEGRSGGRRLLGAYWSALRHGGCAAGLRHEVEVERSEYS